MTIRLRARHKAYPLSHVDVAVTYHHGGDNGHNFFERHITLQGALDDQQRMQLLRGAESCPVGRSLGVSVEIQTSSSKPADPVEPPADYSGDLEEFSLVNIDPD
jgi:putative redox protein